MKSLQHSVFQIGAWRVDPALDEISRDGLAIIYDKLGGHADAEAELVKLKATKSPQDDSVEYAQICAQWGQTAKALSSLEAALRIRHVALEYLKTWPLLDPLRKEPRFHAVEQALKFPD